MRKLQALAMITQINVADQFDKKVAWDLFVDVPKVFVLAGKPAAEDAKLWGVYLQERFNSGYQPTPEHLRRLDSNEKVKVIAVAALPDVPGIFKGLFRSGFRREAKEMGLVLDFDRRLSRLFDYSDASPIPRVVILPAGEMDAKGRHLTFTGPSTDAALKERVAIALESYVKEAALKP